MTFSLLLLFSILFLSGCTITPPHIASNDHAHSETELHDPHHHDINHNNHTTPDTNKHTMNHADMVSDPLSFIAEMIPHHQEAVDSSSALLAKTTNPKLKTILENIIQGQSQEITMMKQRLSEYYPASNYQSHYMPMMRATNGITDITILENMYIQDMILHHQGAIAMANKLLTIFEQTDPLSTKDEKTAKLRSQLTNFAQNIITSQDAEIQAFQKILTNLVPSTPTQ